MAETAAVATPEPIAGRRSKAAPRILALDGLRGIAILGVLVFHFSPQSGPLSPLRHIAKFGWMGVDLFFILSGFLITGILLDSKGKPRYYRNFIARRAVRIFPLYFACLAIYALIAVVQHASLAGWRGIWPFAAYIGNVPQAIVNEAPQFVLLRPLWSLQIEEQFYLLFPLIVAVSSVRRLRLFLWSCILCALALRLASVLVVGESMRLACYVLTPCRMDALAMGGLIAIHYRAGSLSTARARIAILGGMLGCVVVFYLRPTTFRDPVVRSIGYTMIALTFAGLIQLILAVPAGRFSRTLSLRPLVYVGQISYGVYLLQMPAEAVARAVLSRWFAIAPGSGIDLLIALPASLLLASISWFFFERPLLRLNRS